MTAASPVTYSPPAGTYGTPQFLAVAAREYASFALGQVEVVL
jgi:hypothetical protein